LKWLNINLGRDRKFTDLLFHRSICKIYLGIEYQNEHLQRFAASTDY